MLRNVILWVLAVILTVASAVYQRRTGPTYPIEGERDFAGTTVAYSLERSHGGDGDQEVTVIVPDARVQGHLLYKRHKTRDDWKVIPMKRSGDRLSGFLPHQPPAGKLEYFVELKAGAKQLLLPEEDGPAVTRFKGAVPEWILAAHIVVIFLAMLFSMRGGLEALFRDGNPRGYALWTFALLAVGGMLLGPVVQKFAFGEYWTGFPFGKDLTDNKTAFAFLAWLVAVIALWNRNVRYLHPNRRWFAFAASVVTLVVFLIPHSLWGSELEYTDSAGALPVERVTGR
ncbi:MAG: hypothetical protein QHI48_02160 [Bacteroidota bacterium]|nr:hypothetical protein [Bacteroidota bacterium]